MSDAIQFSFKDLPSYSDGWQDGLHWLQEIKVWSQNYEEQNMVPTVTNIQLADAHIEILCMNVPQRYIGICKSLMSVLLGKRLGKAMM